MYRLYDGVRMADATGMNTDAYVLGGGFNKFLLYELEFAFYLFKLSCLMNGENGGRLNKEL